MLPAFASFVTRDFFLTSQSHLALPINPPHSSHLRNHGKHPCGAWHHWTRLPDSAFAKTLGGQELCPTLDQHLKANKLAGQASTVVHLTRTPFSVPPSLLHHVPRFPFPRCAGLLHLLILLPTQHVQSSREASTAILIFRFAFAFSFVRIFLCSFTCSRATQASELV